MSKPILTIACVATVLTLLKAAVTPVSPPSEGSVLLPEQLPLKSWHWTNSDIADDTGRYHYRSDDTQLDIQVTLQQGGDLLSKTRHSWNLPVDEFEVTEQQGVGAYGTFAVPETAYLTACMTPSGVTTATARQFGRSQLQQAVRPQHIAAWFVDRTALRDPRCLWVTLSTPLTSEEQAAASFQTLEAAWLELNTHWQPQFPDI